MCLQVLPLGQEERGSYAFQGLFSEQQRDAEYAGTADHYRCGYMAPSGFDIIRDFPGFHQCKVVVVNLIAKGRDVLLNLQNVGKHNLADPRMCFISIMDINGVPFSQVLLQHGGHFGHLILPPLPEFESQATLGRSRASHCKRLLSS
jgi:hypothetical protein